MECGSNLGRQVTSQSSVCDCECGYQWWLCVSGAGCWEEVWAETMIVLVFPTQIRAYVCICDSVQKNLHVRVTASIVGLNCE